MDMRCPWNHGQIYGHEGVLPTGNWQFLSASTKVKLVTTSPAELQHPLKGVQGRNQKWDILCSGKSWQNRPSDSYIFSGKDFHKPQLLHLLILTETLTSWTNVCLILVLLASSSFRLLGSFSISINLWAIYL